MMQGGTEGPSHLAGRFPSSLQLCYVFPVLCVLNQTTVTGHCAFRSSLMVADCQSQKMAEFPNESNFVSPNEKLTEGMQGKPGMQRAVV